jgi:GNAT superfamily N-acetyltransferase
VQIQPYNRDYLPQLLELVNLHLSTVVPGWGLTGEFLSASLRQDPSEPLTDPWVVERATLCAVGGGRVLAAAHLLRYGEGEEVGNALRGSGEINWVMFRPRSPEAATAVLAAARKHVSAWGARSEVMWGGGVYIPAFCGVPDCWPHVLSALEDAGYRPDAGRRETLYGGTLDGGPDPGDPPLAGLALKRTVGAFGTRFSASLDGEELGRCECVPDLTRGGALPALGGWAELGELWIREEWRNRRIGTWLVQQAVSWLRLAGCDRVVLSVAAEDEAAGADRFYRRFGWKVFTRETRSWTRKTS